MDQLEKEAVGTQEEPRPRSFLSSSLARSQACQSARIQLPLIARRRVGVPPYRRCSLVIGSPRRRRRGDGGWAGGADRLRAVIREGSLDARATVYIPPAPGSDRGEMLPCSIVRKEALCKLAVAHGLAAAVEVFEVYRERQLCADPAHVRRVCGAAGLRPEALDAPGAAALAALRLFGIVTFQLMKPRAGPAGPPPPAAGLPVRVGEGAG
jgi:hypothetical protein